MDNREKLARLAEMGQDWDNDTPRKYDFMREEWHDCQGRDPQRMADDTDALIWFGKWAGIGMMLVIAVYIAVAIVAAIVGRV